MENLWLIPASILGCGLLYALLQRILVKWFCRTFLYGRVRLASNGNLHEVSLPETGVKLSEGDEVELSLLAMTWLMGALTSVISIMAMLETWHDTLFARSTVLIPWTHVAAWYYIVDTYAMYMAFSMRKNIVHRRTKAKLILFLLEKWSYILHHLFIAVGYVVIVNDHLRGYKGDFYAAALLAQDLSNPFLANAKILKIVSMTGTFLYSLNGAVLICVFLVARVLNNPLCLLMYAAQYHSWDMARALGSLRWSCYVGILVQFSFQLYWFILLLKLAVHAVRDWSKQTPVSSQNGRTVSHPHRAKVD